MDIYIAKGGQQTGPFTEDQLKSMIQSGMANLSDQAWHQDLTEWTPLHRILKLSPPIPSVQPPPFRPSSAAPVTPPVAHSGEPASFGIRVGAYIIDFIVVGIGAFVAGFVVGAVFLSGGNASADEVETVGNLVGLLTGWLYFALMESSPKQATVGKLACGLVVTDLSGQRINFGKASGRYFAMIPSALILGIGFLMCLWTQRKQCLHDIMAGCLVVTK